MGDERMQTNPGVLIYEDFLEEPEHVKITLTPSGLRLWPTFSIVVSIFSLVCFTRILGRQRLSQFEGDGDVALLLSRRSGPVLAEHFSTVVIRFSSVHIVCCGQIDWSTVN